jgi:hypothetical protein
MRTNTHDESYFFDYLFFEDYTLCRVNPIKQEKKPLTRSLRNRKKFYKFCIMTLYNTIKHVDFSQHKETFNQII